MPYRILCNVFRLITPKRKGGLVDPQVFWVILEGLQRMIELRGGVSQLASSEPGLAQMIFK
jgi:hypothetical protein